MRYWTLYLFSDWPKSYNEFSKSAPVTSSLQLYNNTSRTLTVTGDHVKFACFVFLPVGENVKTCLPFLFVLYIIQQLLDSIFMLSRIFKNSVIGNISNSVTRYLGKISLSLITPNSTLIILDLTKSSSNICL